MTSNNPHLLEAQQADPDLQLIRLFRLTNSWDTKVSPCHRLQLEQLNRNLHIDQDGAPWINCPGQGPDVPTLKAVYLPAKYRQPIICHFRQRNPDLPIAEEIIHLQENYCLLNMQSDLINHADSCQNCKLLKASTKCQEIPNARGLS